MLLLAVHFMFLFLVVHSRSSTQPPFSEFLQFVPGLGMRTSGRDDGDTCTVVVPFLSAVL